MEVSHKSSQQERDITMKTKDEYLTQLQDRLLKQQTENDEERTRLQNLVAKMEVQIRERSRKFEEDKWQLSQVYDNTICRNISIIIVENELAWSQPFLNFLV